MSNIPLEQGDFERQVEFDFLRATESAALNTLEWLGKGQKEKADEAACDAIRGTLDLVNIVDIFVARRWIPVRDQ
jgi:fructose-1,6-bisphosphatase II